MGKKRKAKMPADPTNIGTVTIVYDYDTGEQYSVPVNMHEQTQLGVLATEYLEIQAALGIDP